MQTTDTKAWRPAADEWRRFCEQHPGIGARGNENSWIHFQRIHAQKLVDADVIRRVAFRGRMLADSTRFEVAVFNLLTLGNVEGRAKPGRRP
ncbi:MAG: hypothetical protein IPJ52_05865 [Rhodocyclaceae bacterium]|nr:hypothetical protein [Rhodocyclaceae bacterium]